MSSSGWNPGLQQRPNSPGDPGLVKLCGKGPCHPGDSHNKLCCKCDQGEIDTLVMPWVNAQVAYLLAV